MKFVTFLSLCVYVCVWLSQVHCETPNSYPKFWLISRHRLHHSTSYFLLYCAISFFLTARLSLDSPAPRWLTSPVSWASFFGPTFWVLNVWPPYCRSPTPNPPTSFVLSSGLAGSRGHNSLCSFRAKIEKIRSFRHSDVASKMLKIIPPAIHNTDPHTYIHTHTHTHIYIYIYIYIIFTNPSARAGYDTRSIFLSGV